MTRPLRIEFPGAVYHVTSRGDRREAIFDDDVDRQAFIDVVALALKRFDACALAFCLMDNHYHLVLHTRQSNLSVLMHLVNGVYTQAYNRRHAKVGHLFQGRYKALVVQSDSGEYFSSIASYIHLNPVRARLIDIEKLNLSEYPWSSFPCYLNETNRPEWLHVERVLDKFQSTDDSHGMRGFCRMMQQRSLEIYCSKDPSGFDETWKSIRRGWCLG